MLSAELELALLERRALVRASEHLALLHDAIQTSLRTAKGQITSREAGQVRKVLGSLHRAIEMLEQGTDEDTPRGKPLPTRPGVNGLRLYLAALMEALNKYPETKAMGALRKLTRNAERLIRA